MKRILSTLALVATLTAATSAFADNGPSPFRLDGNRIATNGIQSVEQLRETLAGMGYQMVNEVKDPSGKVIGTMIKITSSSGISYHVGAGLAPNGDVLFVVPLTAANAAANSSAERLVKVLRLNAEQDLGYFSLAQNGSLCFATWVAAPRAAASELQARLNDVTKLLDQQRSTWDLAN